MSPVRAHGVKIPAITSGFWIIKIFATTLGETAGDTVSMTWDLGYLAGTLIFASALLVLVTAQIAAAKYRPFLYWATIIASTTAGTTLADFADRSLGIGYAGGAIMLLTGLIAVLAAWRLTLGTVSVESVKTPAAEAFYWATITVSQTLGTALGDWAADDGGLGYGGGAVIFGGLLAVVALLYVLTRANRVILFWLAFILTRPLGATIGDFLDKPVAHGGLDLSRPLASAVLAAVILMLVLLLPQRPVGEPAVAPAGDTANQ